MMNLHKISDFLRKQFQSETPSSRPTDRLRLEELEDRTVPSFFANTYTNVSVQITPAVFGNVTETVTATVTTAPSFDPFTNTTTPPPAAAGTNPPAGGTVLFNLNNQQASATLNSNGQATATFTLPFFSLFSSKILTAQYLGSFPPSGNDYEESTFTAPLYTNFFNLFLNATLTFNQLTPAQRSGTFMATSPFTETSLPNFYTAQGETDTMSLLTFKYVDPGTIDSLTALGINLPGSFALQLGAYKGIP